MVEKNACGQGDISSKRPGGEKEGEDKRKHFVGCAMTLDMTPKGHERTPLKKQRL